MPDTASRASERDAERQEAERLLLLARARNYPYPCPEGSFVWRADRCEAFRPEATAGRTPVLAIGSNRAPEQLARKFGAAGDHAIPVQRARLRDFDVVYSAHITRYGAVPAMLQAAPGTTVELAVTWLDDAQLEIMHATEGNYDFARLDGIDLLFEDGRKTDSMELYVGRHGNLVHAGSAIALAAVAAEGRSLPAMTTAEVLLLVRDRVAPNAEIDAFILRLIADDEFRRDCTAVLGADAVAFGYPY